MTSKNDWYSLKLDEEIMLTPEENSHMREYIKRVPGGWVYTITGMNGSLNIVFIPFDNEFMEPYKETK